MLKSRGGRRSLLSPLPLLPVALVMVVSIMGNNKVGGGSRTLCCLEREVRFIRFLGVIQGLCCRPSL
jgi:hypothetical protein